MTERMLQHFSDVSHCPICKEVFTQPRVILCGHTFCLSCLESMQIKGRALVDRKLECPMCKKISKIPKGGMSQFTVNVMALQVHTAVDEAKQLKNKKICEACSASTLQLQFCQNCESRLCGDCGRNHQDLFPQHVMAADMNTVPTTRCRVHTGRVINMYCSSCREAVCPLCATTSHAGNAHTVAAIEEARAGFIAQMEERVKALKDNSEKLKVTQDEVQQLMTAEEAHYVRQRELVQSEAEAAVKTIEQQEKRLLKKIEEMRGSNVKAIENRQHRLEAKSVKLDGIMSTAEEVIASIEISDFPDKSISLLRMLEEYDSCSTTVCSVGTMSNKYRFKKETGLKLGAIYVTTEPNAAVAAARQPPEQDQAGVIEVEMRVSEAASMTIPKQVSNSRQDQTGIKEAVPRTPMLVGSYILDSGVNSLSMTVVGIGLLANGETVCAYNTNKVGQVVMCTVGAKQQVLYHRRKGISAFALGHRVCSVALEDDCNISRLFLDNLQADREATCMTHKISCRASHIEALAFTDDDLMVFATNTCINGVDHQNRRSFALNGNRSEQSGMFTTVSSIATGPQGELIVYDGGKQRLVVFSSETKLLRYIELPGLSSACSVACDDLRMVYVADRKQNKVVKVAMSGIEDPVDILNANDGLKSPCCLAVRDNSLAVANFKSFSESEVRVFEFVDVRE